VHNRTLRDLDGEEEQQGWWGKNELKTVKKRNEEAVTKSTTVAPF
jgi:hypothetical protein